MVFAGKGLSEYKGYTQSLDDIDDAFEGAAQKQWGGMLTELRSRLQHLELPP
eukprot:CAMPEP_0118712634 /NCGR_PEP_ID=MMETSP0800-20121206/24957_1 /TAXON_ID=210618 ORGANISM="Striatella unipunctata, Strain CCMP2910" /NCGR_SAMPLE_ID=MMETSP0800 /ASSEMBLY_ACC=CAM_ASM_000638 /LENGTH=51 /DNA_ID=CAMNT_0006617771 /DNA_START=15 /DNA_END=167 /DNA_ORIENTATION=-